MEAHTLVRPEHLNHYGFLFGGYLLQWVDEHAYIAAVRDFPGRRFLTVAMDNVTFKRPVPQGVILRFVIEQQHLGTTSVRYGVEVYREAIDTGEETMVFATAVTMVNVDERGVKQPIVTPSTRETAP